MAGEEAPAGSVSPGGSSTPEFAKLGLRTPAGWVPLPAEQALPLPVIPDYTVLRRIGGGAYGEVWLARNMTGSHFAIKVVHRRLFDHDRPYERELDGIQRFEPISRSHPSQVAIHQVGKNSAEGYFYYVMDLADDAAADSRCPEVSEAPRDPTSDLRPLTTTPGLSSAPAGLISDLRPLASRPLVADTYVPRTLKHLMRTRGRLPFAECLDIALALATALENLHGHGLVHRDIKPSNVIFVGGVPKLADIGLVTGIDATQSFVGTEGFFPPEGPGTPRADLFSLGKLLYEIATGKDRHEFPELPTGLGSVEEEEALAELNAIILKCCQHDPAQRYRNAAALRAELERLKHGGSVKRQRVWQRRWVRVQKFAAPVLLLLALVLVLARPLRPPSIPRAAPSTTPSPTALAERTLTSPNATTLIPLGIFILPIRPTETNGAPAELCSRVTDAFIDSLGLLTNQGVQVGPRKSGWACQEEGELLKRVASEPFRMRHALSGQVGLAQDRYELALTWHDLELGKPLWSETFTGRTNELITLEQRALVKMAGSLGVEIAPDRSRQIAQLLTNNLEALGWLQQAQVLFERKGTTQEGITEAMQLTQEALRLDANYLGADCFNMFMLRNLAQERHPSEAWPAVRGLGDAILRKDDTFGVALDQISGHSLFYKRDWDEWDILTERCLQSHCGWLRSFFHAFYLRIEGHPEEARIEEQNWLRVELTDVNSRLFVAVILWADGRYKEGIQAARRTLELIPGGFDGYFMLAHHLVANGDYEEGIRTIDIAQKIYLKQELTALKSFAYARMGQLATARGVLKELLDLERFRSSTYLNPYFVARVYAALGEKQVALDWLEKAADDRSEYLYIPHLGGLRTDLAWMGLQEEARYWKLCDRLGLGKDQWPRKLAGR